MKQAILRAGLWTNKFNLFRRDANFCGNGEYTINRTVFLAQYTFRGFLPSVQHSAQNANPDRHEYGSAKQQNLRRAHDVSLSPADGTVNPSHTWVVDGWVASHSVSGN